MMFLFVCCVGPVNLQAGNCFSGAAAHGKLGAAAVDGGATCRHRGAHGPNEAQPLLRLQVVANCTQGPVNLAGLSESFFDNVSEHFTKQQLKSLL